MCGIAGIVGSIGPDARSVVETMLAAMKHRGPDATGIYSHEFAVLGHNRLSIIDLSAASNQPMKSHGCLMTYNGEIYNYIELRQELQSAGYHFSTTGDSEVILAAYDHWGPTCVDHFIGMWALAIWDPEKRTLFCSRDRFGIKPFHYSWINGVLIFASEVKGIISSGMIKREPDTDQLMRFVHLGWITYGTGTCIRGVNNLPAAHNLEWKDGKLRTWRYYELPAGETNDQPFEESVDQFRELFTDSVRLCSRRDVDMGICLSGGLDSTSIVSVLATNRSESAIKAFTAFYEGRKDTDERPYIKHVLDRYPIIESHTISPTDNEVAEAIDDIIRMMDYPLPSSSYVSQYFVMKLAARNGVKVVLDGQGSDEMLGGYMHSIYRIIADHLRSGKALEAVHTLLAHRRRQGYSISKVLSSAVKSIVLSLGTEDTAIKAEFNHSMPGVFRRRYSDININVPLSHGKRFNTFLKTLIEQTLLPVLLHTEDINSMAFSIESRVPFLDHRLVEASMRMPTEHRSQRGETKRVLRAAMRGIVPNAVLDRKDKTGFITPGDTRWLRGPLSHLLDGPWSITDDIINAKHITELIAAFRAGDNRNSLLLWRLTMLRQWLAR